MSFAMALAARKKTEDELIRELEQSQEDEIGLAEPIKVQQKPAPPTSVRLSPPLLKKLQEMASSEHRTLGNLIQHILWDFVQNREASRSIADGPRRRR
jgi:predicted DNA-binding ribbon-helix-helix protein